MTEIYDALVLGVGGMGSAACYHLARRGCKVLGLEQFTAGHALGSSHGETRLIRQAYFEHPAYVPLLRRAYELWRELEDETGKSLLHLNGLVIYGPETGGSVLPGVRASGEAYGVPLVAYDAASAKTAFGPYQPPAGSVAVLEPGAGYLDVEDCVRAHVAAARKHGAVIQENEAVSAVTEDKDSVTVTTQRGTYRARQLVVTAGPWSRAFLPRFSAELQVRRVLLFWFAADASMDAANGLPCFGFDRPEGFFYGVPAVSTKGVKVGLHVPGASVSDPVRLDRQMTAADLAPVKRFVSECLPGVVPEPTSHAACMYTMTPDEHFIVGKDKRTSYAAGFSGHGFKFASVMGEALADLALTGTTALPIDFLAPRW